jgi:hypothetical protein
MCCCIILQITGPFWFDAFTSIPVSFFELAAATACASVDASPEVDSGQVYEGLIKS